MKKAAVIAILLTTLFFSYALDVDTFCYDRLDLQGQIAYEAFYECISCIIPKWNSGSFSQETLQKSYESLLMDHPELYWSETFTFVTSFSNNEISGHHVEFDYTMDRTEIEQTNEKIRQSLSDILLTLDDFEPDYENVRRIYEWFVKNCSYDERNMDQTMYSVMIDRSGVCASFSKAFEFVVQCLGIPCTVINGRLIQSPGFLGTSAGHQWNLIQLDGKWYHVDVTSGLAMSGEKICYDFLCCSDEEILKTHIIDNIVPVPECRDSFLI